MTSPWSEGQVASVAPDAGSLAAAAKLSAAWTQTGGNGDALWGLCQGSGKSPYRSVVDLTGPAYHCSCPSRKFPCKHTLGLLLIWSQGRVAEQSEPPEFANDWLTRRAGRAVPAAATRTAGAKATERRAERVAAGLDELDLWLTDQIRGGLGAADISASAFDAIAARMVDAQAPGIASTLRRLPIVVATRADWPDRLLREYARLHLLVVAHRRLRELPEPLQASVRSHVGYPVATDSVRAEPGVRDRWMVLGMQTTEEKRLFTRRVWLLGRDHGRRAILLDFAHGSGNFSTVIPPLGSLVDATLHFYPGAAPLRAQFGDTHEPPEPFTTVAPSDIDTALDDFAAAVGADPWIRSWPALLTGVTPAYDGGSWFVVDGQGRALPLSGEDPVQWRLLGMSGGSPVTVFGEWTSDSLVPVSVFDRGDVYPLVAAAPSTAGSRR
ncbi:SWIM zinc finger family protein [Rhodococcus koreensis]|uniref:SWIM zinc finger family protein n=1 Tax=Rhodococcus koreensis TaxID=99653 RepID=UPI003670A4D8